MNNILNVHKNKMTVEFNVQLYDAIGSGRESPNYSQTIVSKGRIKESIDFVASKSVDILRQDEVYHSVQIMGKFNHDNIVKFINWYVTNTKLYVILEYCPGGTLLDLLERDVCLPESVIRIFSSDVLSALHYIHNKGFIFHDLSPRNILLDECGVLKLSDFARATMIDEPVDLSNYDIEILEYLPPEMFKQDSVSSFASDFYALGCLMYRMATGATPFVSSDINELKDKILNVNPPKVEECSDDFNDFVIKLLNKDPYKRPTWTEIVNHPFWEECLSERLDQEFKNFDENLLPPQPIWEASKGFTFQINESIDLSKSLRVSAHPQINENLSTISSNINASSVLSATISSNLSSTVQDNNKTISTNIEPSINNLIVSSPLLAPATVVLNTNIESFPLSPIEGVSLPVTSSMLKTKPSEAISKVRESLNKSDRVKLKAPLISFLIEQSKSTDVANNLANSTLFPEFIIMAKETKHPSLAAGFLLLYGTVLKYATSIDQKYLTEESINNIQFLSCSSQEKIARKAISVLGQMATYIANGILKISMPSFLISTLIKSLQSQDEPQKHYGLRSIANLLYYDIDIDLMKLEQILLSFDFLQSQYLTETFSICISLFYKKNHESNIDFAINLIKTLISRPSPTLQTLAIIIASSLNLISHIKDGIIISFKNSAGELKIKSFLAMCLLFNNNPEEFIEYSQRFFNILEKISTEFPEASECVMKWTTNYCESIVGTVIENSNIDLMYIVYNAMQIRQVSTRIWTPKFEKKIEKCIRNNTFNSDKSEVIIQIVQCALCYQLCDISIVADMCRPINSQRAVVRFAVVKLVADASMQRPIHSSVKAFIENNIMTQILPLLQDEDCIVDQTLRILANVSNDNPEFLKQIANKQTVLGLIFNSISDNQSALQLSIQLLAYNEVPLDSMTNTRFIPALIGSIDKKENIEKIIELLKVALTTIESRKKNRNFIKQIHNLATIAPKVASLILDYPQSGECFCLLIKIFTPQAGQSEVVLESAFNPFAATLSSGLLKPELSSVFSEIIKTFTWAVENSPPTRLKLKGSSKLMTALKKAAENAPDDVKQAASLCLKIIK